jgi:hypothetical protein
MVTYWEEPVISGFQKERVTSIRSKKNLPFKIPFSTQLKDPTFNGLYASHKEKHVINDLPHNLSDRLWETS